MSAVSDLAASQLTGVSKISVFGSLVWYNAGSDWGFSTDFRARAGISSGWHLIGITNVTGGLDSEQTSITLITFYHIKEFSSK